MIKKLSITGIRSFKDKQEIIFAVPDMKNKGSGLTTIVGPNNSGKSTMIECIHHLTKTSNSFDEGFRNVKSKYKSKIEADVLRNYQLEIDNDAIETISIESRNIGSSLTNNSHRSTTFKAYIISSHKKISTYFQSYPTEKEQYMQGNIENYRNEQGPNQNFGSRLISIEKNGQKEEFDKYLHQMLPNILRWDIETRENQSYLKFETEDGIYHNSLNSGEGIINLFSLADALITDTNEIQGPIVIDEPEVSLHPDVQKRVLDLLLEKSKTMQIIICTHSPYFIDWKGLLNGGMLYRFTKANGQTNCHYLRDKGKGAISKIINDVNNIRTLGTEAKEILFLEQNLPIVITEGQDDVIHYSNYFKQIGIDSLFSFYGWGASGADKITLIQRILFELGYLKVISILDYDQKGKSVMPILKEHDYGFLNLYIPAQDVIKDCEKTIPPVSGRALFKINKCKNQYVVNEIFKDDLKNTIESMLEYAKSDLTSKNKYCNNSTESSALNKNTGTNYSIKHEKFIKAEYNKFNTDSIVNRVNYIIRFHNFNGGGDDVIKEGDKLIFKYVFYLTESSYYSIRIIFTADRFDKIYICFTSFPVSVYNKIKVKLLEKRIDFYYRKLLKKSSNH